jgi:tetratricopeptide (TPR) repeat protein
MTLKKAHKETLFHMRHDVLVCLFLLITTLAVFWQVRSHEFVNFDDDRYITKNHHVRAGLSVQAISWAFAATYESNWHPLTWLSHMLDCQVYGIDPEWHHLTSLFFHLAGTLLLFLVLRRMTGDLWPSAFVAALFALHPLHVESVAWVAERKDVLSTFFWMLTLWGYLRYVEHPGMSRYLLVLLFFILGLISKPMLVTLPFVLLLLDYWPLNRIQLGQSRPLGLVREKTPFFVLAAGSCVITFVVQQSGGAVSSLNAIPLNPRLANALVSYVGYLGKMLWPHNLAVLYPYQGSLPGWQVAGACLLLASIFFLVIYARKQYPYLVVGWLWYVGTLVPVIGLVQVGSQAMADRYTYVPLIGIFIMIAWGVPELVARWRHRKVGLATVGAALLSILMATAWLQVRYWANSITLFEHAIDIAANSHKSHDNLGNALAGQGKLKEAVNHYLEALRIKPDYMKSHNNLGTVLARQGKLNKAISHFSAALRIKPDYAEAHYNLGTALAKKGKLKEAIKSYLEALGLKPDYVDAHYNLGIALASQGKLEKAIRHYTEALVIKPDYAEAHYNLGNVLMKQGRLNEAIGHYLKTLQIKPDYAKAHNNLGNALARQGELKKAIGHFSEALRIKPDFLGARRNLDLILRLEETPSEASNTTTRP